ncbi:MAG: CPBP family intramembrane metalloprotease [Akkermansiaceae bacterium]|jgi:membrane protease YdiL (CAAX protease family)|nr:CPBP family intramembrane metalloprotease [Akkermansiaceae bacterium]
MPDFNNITVAVLALCLGGGVGIVVAAWLARALARRATGGTPPMPSGKVEVWPYRAFDWLWMGLLVAFFAVLGIGNADAKAGGTAGGISQAGLIQTMLFQLFLTTVTLAVMIGRIGPLDWLGLRWPQWPWVLLLGPACVIGVWVTGAAINLGGYHALMVHLGVDRVQDTVRLLKEHHDPTVLALMAVAAVVVAPVCEEVIFRGYLYPAAKRFAGRWVAMIASALVFAAAHGSLAQLPQLFILGLVLVHAYEVTKSIWAPIAIHLCNNAATVVILFAIRLSGIELPDTL